MSASFIEDTFGLSPELLALTGLAFLAGGAVKGVVGLGLPIVAMAIALNFLPAHLVLAALTMPILVTNLWQAGRMGNPLEPVRRFWPMIVLFLVFLVIGARLVVGLDNTVLFAILGSVVVVFSASQLLRPPRAALSPRAERLGGPVAGVLGGLLGGLTTVWGPPMVMFLMLLKLDKDTWVRTLGLIWFLGSLPLIAAYWQNGLLNENTLPLSCAACVPGLIGTWIGERIRARIDQEAFRKVLLVVLFLIGLNLVRRAVL